MTTVPSMANIRRNTESEMNTYRLFEHYKMMEEQNIVLSFKGEISNNTLISLAEMFKRMFAFSYNGQKTVKKVFSIFIELAQNIYLYSAKRAVVDNKEVGVGIIVIEKSNNFYRIKSGNMIANTVIAPLVDKISHINSLEKDKLKDLYNQQLKSPREKGKTGGGVGLITIVRKSGNPLGVILDTIDTDQTFIELSAKVDEEDN
jgi:hypothetical protein